jgi:hypothetical protein
MTKEEFLAIELGEFAEVRNNGDLSKLSTQRLRSLVGISSCGVVTETGKGNREDCTGR